MRAYLLVISIALVLFGGIAGFLYYQYAAFAGADYTPPPVTVGAGRARTEVRQATLDAVGTITAARGVKLSTEERGEVTAIDFDSGAKVEKGQLLVTLNDKVEQASKERQTANLKLARIPFKRDEKLVKQKSIPESQFDRSKADLESATAQLSETEARLENKRIHAPFSGTVGIIQVKIGDYVEPGTTITTLQDLSELEVDFTLPARYFPRLKPGLELVVRVAAFPDKRFKATLQAVDSLVDADTRNLLLRAQLLQSEGLLPGMFAQLQLNLGEPARVVTVPETAITYSLHGNTVYVVEHGREQLTVDSRIVSTGESLNGRVAVLTGLNAGEEVVTAGQNKLYRGATIEIDESIRF